MIRTEQREDVLTAFLSGELDHHAAKAIREQLDGEIIRTGVKNLILDFRDVTFMDSSGIGLVMGRYKLVREQDGAITIANSSVHIKRVMKLAGMDKLANFV